MGKYPLTQEQILFCYQYDLLTLLLQRGYQLGKNGNRVFLKEHDSLIVDTRSNLWCWHSQVRSNGKKVGGNVVQFLTDYEGMSKMEAYKAILAHAGQPVPEPDYLDRLRKQTEKKWYVPHANYDNDKVLEYLVGQRKLEPDIVDYMIKAHLIYESYKYHNAVFVGRDENGKARSIFMRSTEGDIKLEVPHSDKAYSFRYIGYSDTAYLFEGAIDLLSHASMFKLCGRKWYADTRVSLGGISPKAMDKVLEYHPNIRNIVICTDNDSPGIQAAKILEEYYQKKGFNVRVRQPRLKDFNKDLMEGEGWERRRQIWQRRSMAAVSR